MKLLLEDFVPYDKSLRWRIHDAYYSRRGTAAWTEGDIPYLSTSNLVVARHHARFFLRVVAEMERTGDMQPDEPVAVLEIGSGLGRFAANFIRALATGCGQPGRRLLPRLRYVLSDYAEASVREASRTPGLREYAASGTVVPALFDFRRPEILRSLEGASIQLPLTAVLANYVCCISPVKLIRKTPAGTFEQRLRIEAELPPERESEGVSAPALLDEILREPTRANLMKSLLVTSDWKAVKLEELLPRPVHAEVIRAALAPFSEATVVYPFFFLELLEDIAPRMKPGGIALVNDYGSGDAGELAGLAEGAPQYYGNTMNHAINFAVFDAFCAATGQGLVRSWLQPSGFQTAAIRYGREITNPLTAAFRRSYGTHENGDALLDFGAAALQAFRDRHFDRAVRLYRRCLKFDPRSIEILYKLGEACVEGRYYRLALPYLMRGARLDPAQAVDFHFQLGRAWYSLKEPQKALHWYHLSLSQVDHPATRCNIGLAYEALGRKAEAMSSYRRALELDPTDALAARLMSSLTPADTTALDRES